MAVCLSYFRFNDLVRFDAARAKSSEAHYMSSVSIRSNLIYIILHLETSTSHQRGDIRHSSVWLRVGWCSHAACDICTAFFLSIIGRFQIIIIIYLFIIFAENGFSNFLHHSTWFSLFTVFLLSFFYLSFNGKTYSNSPLGEIETWENWSIRKWVRFEVILLLLLLTAGWLNGHGEKIASFLVTFIGFRLVCEQPSCARLAVWMALKLTKKSEWTGFTLGLEDWTKKTKKREQTNKQSEANVSCTHIIMSICRATHQSSSTTLRETRGEKVEANGEGVREREGETESAINLSPMRHFFASAYLCTLYCAHLQSTWSRNKGRRHSNRTMFPHL